MSKFTKRKIPSLGATKRKEVFDSNLPKFDMNLLEINEIDRGAYGAVYETIFNNERVVVKKLLPNLANSKDYLSTFSKEASIMHSLDHEGIVKLVGVCEDPVSIMMELCEFSLAPFERDVSFHSLDRLLDYFDREELFAHFPGLCHNVARQISKAISYMHSLNMVHRDIKPMNILVSNLHYAGKTDFADTYQLQPIICKIGDLGESRSVMIQTKQMAGNARTRYVDRGSTTFMAPEILVEDNKLESVGIEDLKLIDVWALLMTFFIILNPDQRWPFYHDLEESSETIDALLSKKSIPSPSEKYLVMQSCKMAQVRYVFYSCLAYNPENRKGADEIARLLDREESIQIYNLDLNQGSALETYDASIAKHVGEADINITSGATVLPDNDGTNSCAFLSLGLIDSFFDDDLMNVVPIDMQIQVEEVIRDFPLQFNPYRDSNSLYDIDESYMILERQNLLRHKFSFCQDYLRNYNTFTYDCQNQIHRDFSELQQAAEDKKQSMFAIFHADKYIFALAFSSKGEGFIFETHPIASDCGGNGNGVIVNFKDAVEGVEWIFTRLFSSGVRCDSKAYVIKVNEVLIEETPLSDNDCIDISSGEESLNDTIITVIPGRNKSKTTPIGHGGNVLTKYAWDRVTPEEVSVVPYDINDLKHYVVRNEDRKQLLRACRDGRKWSKDTKTNWSGFDSVRIKNCLGGSVCPNRNCEFLVMNVGTPNFFHFKNGLCNVCAATAEIVTCSARRYTAYVGIEAHIFHIGEHKCKPKPLTQDVSNVVRAALTMDPFSKPSSIQTANILSALRNRLPRDKLEDIVKNVADRRVISNEMIKVKKEMAPAGSKFDAVKNLKEYTDQFDKFLIYKCDESRNTVFKTSMKKMKLSKEMSDPIITAGEMSLLEEVCCFDGKANSVKGYVTLTASVYHPVIRKQIALASMECIHEDADTVEHFWRTFNEAYKASNEVEEKFQPKGWISDLAGANFNGLAKIYGDDIMAKIKGCEFHYLQNVEKCSKSLKNETPRFRKLSDDLLKSLTPEAFVATVKEFYEFLQGIHQQFPELNLIDWLTWWVDRKEYVFRAYRGSSEPRMNQAEVIHAGWVHRDRAGVTLLDSCYFDIRDSLLLDSEFESFKNGSFSGGCGPTADERQQRRTDVELEASERYGQDIAIHGVKRKIDAVDGFKPSGARANKRAQQMIENRIKKAESLKQIMKVVKFSKSSELRRVYCVKNSVASTSQNEVEICLTPTCPCSDFKKHKEYCNCVHIMFVMLHVLQCNNRDILLKTSIDENDLKAVFNNAPQDIPAELLANIKPPKRSFCDNQGLLRQHPLYGAPQKVELQVKFRLAATCRGCKKKIEASKLCLKVFNAIVLPFNSDKPTTQDVYFCPKSACTTKCPSYVYINLPDSIPCGAFITDDHLSAGEHDLNVIRK